MHKERIYCLAFLFLLFVPTWALSEDTPDTTIAELKALVEQMQQTAADVSEAARKASEAADTAKAAAQQAVAAAERVTASASVSAPAPLVSAETTSETTAGTTAETAAKTAAEAMPGQQLSLDDGLEQRIRAELDKLKPPKTTGFIEACNAMSSAMQDAIRNSHEKPALLQQLATANAMTRIASAIPGNNNLQQEWVKLIEVIEGGQIGGKKPETFDQWVAVYNVGIAVFKNAAEPAAAQPAPAKPAPVKPAAGAVAGADVTFEEEEIIETIATTVRDPAETQLLKDPQFTKSCQAIISALRGLRSQVDLSVISVEEYKKETREAIVEALRKRKMGTLFRKEWMRVYDEIFLSRVAASTKLDDTTAEGWDKIIVLLIAGLTKAIGEDLDWQKEQKQATSSSAGAASGPQIAGGVGTGGSVGLSPHTARQIRRIRNRAAVYRARTQAILGR